MEAVFAAATTGAFALIGVWLTVRRPMKREHAENVEIGRENREIHLESQQTLWQIETSVQAVSEQVEHVGARLDGHIEAHARGDYT